MSQRVVDPVDTLVKETKKRATVHIKFLAKLPTWGFVLAVGAWTVLFKTALVPVVAILNDFVFAPIGLATIYTYKPLLDLADYLTKMLYNIPFVGWATGSTISQLLFVAVLFPLISTGLAQVIPLKSLEKKIPDERWRAATSIVVLGALYLFAYGEVALFVSGAVIAVPLVFTFFHRMRMASVLNAYLITFGVHAVANALVIVSRVLFGEV